MMNREILFKEALEIKERYPNSPFMSKVLKLRSRIKVIHDWDCNIETCKQALVSNPLLGEEE